MPELVELWRNTGQRGLLIASYNRLEKRLGAMTPGAEAVRVPAHLAPPGSLQAKQLRPLHIQLSLGQSCHRQKVLHVRAQDRTQAHRRVSKAENLHTEIAAKLELERSYLVLKIPGKPPT